MSRGLGKWQRAILAALEDHPEGFILAHLRCSGARPTKADISARQRAAKTLEAKGLCKLLRVWQANRAGVRSAMVAVLRPNTGFPENYALTGYENHVTASGPAWSNRATARRLGVSPGMVATTRRRLSVEAAQCAQVQHLGGRA